MHVEISPPAPRFPAVLSRFNRKAQDILAGKRPALSKDEKRWLRAFNVVADEFEDSLTKDESYALSFEALWRAYLRKAAGCYQYVLVACRNAHRDYLKRLTPPLRFDRQFPLGDQPDRFAWANVDAWLDFEEALAEMAKRRPNRATALRMRRDGYTHEEIADALQVSVRHAYKIVQNACEEMRRRLKDYGED